MKDLIWHSDPVSALMKPFDVALRLTVPNGAAYQLVGLQGVSEKIAGPPGWYLWFSDNPGAFLLELVRAEMRMSTEYKAEAKQEPFAGTYVVKYYPSCDDAKSLGSFSAWERALRQSEFFDSTGAPDIELADDLPESSFTVGTLDIESFSHGRELVLLLEAPDRWVTYVKDAQSLAGPDGQPLVTLRPGERDRNVAAWDLSWFLLDRLLKILLFAYHAHPASAAVLEGTDSSYWINTKGRSSPKADETLCVRWLRVTLRLFDGVFHDYGSSGREDVESAACVMNSLAPSNESFTEKAIEASEWISSEWWSVADRALPDVGVVHC